MRPKLPKNKVNGAKLLNYETESAVKPRYKTQNKDERTLH